MIKKYLSLIIVLLLSIMISACVEPVEETQTGKLIAGQDSSLGIANPVRELSRQELIDETGIDLGCPENADNLVYSVIELESSKPIAQLSFTMDAYELCYRAQAVAGENAVDISGMYYDWIDTEHVFVNGCYAVLYMADGAGYIKWIDMAPGIQYSLSMTEGAEKQLLQDIAARVFAPVQGDVG